MPTENCCRATVAQFAVEGDETPIAELSIKIDMISVPG